MSNQKMKKLTQILAVIACCLIAEACAFAQTNSKKMDLSDTSKYEVHELNMNLSFDDDGWNTSVYDSPELQNKIYTLQRGDNVKISRFVIVLASKKSSVEVEISNGTYGFISVSNPYTNGNFSYFVSVSLSGICTIGIFDKSISFKISLNFSICFK